MGLRRDQITNGLRVKVIRDTHIRLGRDRIRFGSVGRIYGSYFNILWEDTQRTSSVPLTFESLRSYDLADPIDIVIDLIS